MKAWIFAAISFSLALGFGSLPRAASISSAQDPFALISGAGEISGQPAGITDTSNRVQVSSNVSAPTTTAVIVTTGQSNIQSTAEGTYTTTQTGSDNFNIYDGGTYQCKNPVLGTQGGPNSLNPNSNSANCQIADSLIGAGTYTRVIMVPTAISGSLCSQWISGGPLLQRIVVTMARLAAHGLTPGSGWTGAFWIILHQGEGDNVAGTPRATLAACLRNYAQAYVDNGATGSARFFVPTQSISSNTANSTVTNGQADAVASGCSTCRQGANVDSLTGGTNRQTDGTHLTQTGASNLSALDVTIITNCKNTVC